VTVKHKLAMTPETALGDRDSGGREEAFPWEHGTHQEVEKVVVVVDKVDYSLSERA